MIALKNSANEAPVKVIRNFHAHIYFDTHEMNRAQALAAQAHGLFGVSVGHFHGQPVGPHPRGSVQLTVETDRFGIFAQWLALNRDGLIVFVHPSTGDDWADHVDHVIWFGPSETLRPPSNMATAL